MTRCVTWKWPETSLSHYVFPDGVPANTLTPEFLVVDLHRHAAEKGRTFEVEPRIAECGS